MRLRKVPALFALIIVGTAAGEAARQQPTIEVVEIGADEVRFTYDPAKLKPYVLRDLLQVSPFTITHMPPSLELCVDGDPDYRPCGNRVLGAENFFANAEVNIKKGRALLSTLDRLNVPPRLRPALQHYRRGAAFWACLESARLAYYRGNNDALRTTCDGVDAVARCPAFVKQASVARSSADRDDLAKSSWHNCMNDAFHEGYGEYPIDAWRAFLKEFGIEETVLTNP